MQHPLAFWTRILVAAIGIGLLTPSAFAASCGAENQRPCTIFERIPSCDKGLVEDFAKGRCVRKVRPGIDCGRLNQRPCTVIERIPSCNKGLVEDFKKGRCVQPAKPGIDCGRQDQRPCTVVERIPSCNKGLVEDFAKGRCVKPAVPGVDCGNENQRPCKVYERIPSCNANLKEDFAKGVCVAVPCGKENGRPCTVLERIPSCDAGLVEDFLKHRCVKSQTRIRQEIAAKKLAEIANFVVGKVSYATQIAQNPNVVKAVNADKPKEAARSVNAAAAGGTTLPDGSLLRTLTVGATVGAKAIVGGSAGAGAAIDFTGRLPVYAYATADYDVSLGFGAAGGVDVGFWVCQANKIGGDAWGVEFGPKDIAEFAKVLKGAESASLANMIKPGWDVGVALWFGYDNVFQGFTLTPSVGAGVDFGGVVWATTAVQDDPSVGCDGAPIHAGTQPPPPPTGGIKPIFGGGEQFVQDIAYTNGAIHGTIRQFQTKGAAARKTLTRVCVVNSTGTPKSMTHAVAGVNPLTTDKPGSESCANFPSHTRLTFDFVDNGKVVKSDAMNLSAYTGSLVRFEWLATVGADQTFVQDIKYSVPNGPGGSYAGLIRHFRIDGGSGNPSVTRVCLLNKTLHRKALTHQVRGVGTLKAAGKDDEACANFPSSTRLEFSFVDRDRDVRKDAMSLSAYAGDIVRFTWLDD